MSNSIVTVNVTQQVAPAPNFLQQTGAMVSQGGTTLTPGTTGLLTQKSDLTGILMAAITPASLTQSAGIATATLKSSTISSGSYDSTTGIATLTLAAGIGVLPGAAVTVANATGTGSYADLDGTWIAQAGSAGTTLHVQLATGLTMTITGGDVNASLGLANGTTFWTDVAGAAQTAYNGRFLATVASDDTFTYTVPSGTVSPATGSVTVTLPGVVELEQMANTFYAQGAQLSVYVFEAGAGTPAQGVSALNAYITANPNQFYSYLVPRSWAGESTFLTFLAGFTATTAKTYFFITATVAQQSSFGATLKCAIALVESPDVVDTEFSSASDFWVSLHYKPAPTNKVTPFAFSALFGVTAYPSLGNGSTLAALKAASANYVGTGAEGGLSNTLLYWGTTKDGRDFSYWYSVDWVQINVPQALAAAVMNGSNNPQNPLYYDQDGINRLQAVAVAQMSSAISFGLALGSLVQTELDQASFIAAIDAGTYAGKVVVNAVPFSSYVATNPSDYPAGIYGGLTVAYTPNRGFKQIIFNVIVSDFASA